MKVLLIADEESQFLRNITLKTALRILTLFYLWAICLIII